MRIALFGNTNQTRKNVCVAAVVARLRQLGADIVVEQEFAKFIGKMLGVDLSGCHIEDLTQIRADVALSLGGDGTFLWTAAAIGDRRMPILGVNTGRLGFLADLSPAHVDEGLETLCAGQYHVEERHLLAVELEDHIPFHGYPVALNEAAVLKCDNSALISVEAFIDGELLTNYVADGLIVSTPTGSTGYSLSCGGPIMDPRSHTFALTPVASHSLNIRPVILCDEVELRLVVRSRSEHVLLALDGRSENLPSGITMTIRRAPYTVGVVKIMHRHFFHTLRDKMLWGADERYN